MSDLEWKVLEEDPETDFSYIPDLEEDVLFLVDGDSVIICSVEASDGTIRNGTTSCESDNGCLDYMIEAQMARPLRNGYYVFEKCTVTYFRGDGWTTDDDATLEGKEIRPARLQEIAENQGWKEALSYLWNQLKIQWLYSHGVEL